MAVGDVPLTPIIDTVTGSVTEIGRIFLRTLANAVNGLAPIDATYWTSKATAILNSEVNLGALASGYLKLATAVGVATPTTVPTIPQSDVTGLTGALAGKATLPIAQGDVTNLVADLAAKAPLASPALTGVPTAPTAAAATNTAQLATTAMVQAAIAPLAPLASPALTGVPTVPTAAPGTNTTQAASTAFVQAASSGGAPWVTPAFSAARFAALGAMTWTVAGGGIVTEAYNLAGKTADYSVDVGGTIGGTLGVGVTITLPAGMIAKKTQVFPCLVASGGVTQVAYCYVAAGSALLTILATASGTTNWIAGANNVFASIRFEVQ